MIEIYIAAVVALVAAGVAIGVAVVVSLGIHSDERAFIRAMTDTRSRFARGAARLTDKHVTPPVRPNGDRHREDVRS